MRSVLLLLLLMSMAMVEGRNNLSHSSYKPHKSPPPSSSKSNGKSHKSPPSSPSHSSSKSKGKDHEPPSPPHSSSKNKGKDQEPPHPPPTHSSSKSNGKSNKIPPPSSKSKDKNHKSPPPPPPHSSSKSKSKGHKSPSAPPPLPPSPPKNKDKGGYNYPTSNIFDVMSFGAQGDGQTDDTQAFVTTWKQACQIKGAVVEVPSYFIFVVGPLLFSGPCQNDIIFQIDGKIIPSDVNSWSSIDVPQWIGFSKVRNMVLQGQGLLDGNGHSWWSLPCKAKSPSGRRTKKSCDSPTAIRFYGSYNVTVRDLAINNSPQMHLKFNDCTNIQVDNISISSPYNSPNTDGIHIRNSQNVQIRNSFIQAGDDCVSIQTGSSDIEIHDVYCDHGHGVSIGGLGKDGTQACVNNISVHDVFLKDSTNGVRIKTWQGGSGSAKRIDFSNISMQNVSNPIVINQFYCDAPSCRNQSSAVHVSEVSYNNIKGTYRYGHPVQLACSDSIPCTAITLSDIQLMPTMHASSTTLGGPFCWNAYGNTKASNIPPITCLLNGPPLFHNGNPLSNDNSC